VAGSAALCQHRRTRSTADHTPGRSAPGACRSPARMVDLPGDRGAPAPDVLRVSARDGPALDRRPAVSPGTVALLTIFPVGRRGRCPPTQTAEDVIR